MKIVVVVIVLFLLLLARVITSKDFFKISSEKQSIVQSVILTNNCLSTAEKAMDMTDRGRLIYVSNKNDGLALMKQAIKINANVYSYVMLARCLTDSGNIEEARNNYQAAVDLARPLAEKEAITWNDPLKRESNISVYCNAYTNIMNEFQRFLSNSSPASPSNRR